MTATEDLARYFEVCGFEPDDTISIVTRAAADGPLHWSFVQVSDAPRQIAARSRINCWISANPMTAPADRESRGTTADVYAIRALWADLDVKPGGLPSMKAARKVVDGISELLGTQPVAVVFSGHGLQPRWRIDIGEVHTPERMAPVIERFGELVKMLSGHAGGKADSVYDLPRIIRAPHTTNIKPELEPVPTKVRFFEDAGAVVFEKLLEVLDLYVPARVAPKREETPTEFRHVGMERGDAYVQSALEYIKADLERSAHWDAGHTDEKGRGWEKLQADVAFRLASLAKADWNSLTLDRAQELFVDWAPTGGGWTVRDVIKKWKSQERRADPAEPPAETDDILAGGGASPRRSAADEAAIWSEGDDGEAGAAGGAGDDARLEGPTGDASVFGTPDELIEQASPRPVETDEQRRERELREYAEAHDWRRFPQDDLGNAERLVHRFGSRLKWAPSLKRWLLYEDGAWRETETGGEKCAAELMRELYRLEATFYSPQMYQRSQRVMTSDRLEYQKWVDEQRSTSRVKAAAQAVRFDGLLDVAATAFDSEPMLLNAPNGIVDLADGTLLDHDPELLLRRQIPVEYAPDAKAPKWEAFLEKVQPDQFMRDYLQRIVGYTITGETKEQVVFFHVGPPASGKSVYLEVLTALLGEFARIIPSNTLLNKKMEQHPTDIMGMEGRRLLALDETPEGARLDEALVKRLSGESTLTARGMGENFRDFRMVGKVHLVTNHDPHLSDDPAVHRRLHYIPWRNPIPVEERVQGLAGQIIREELDGVLTWAVRGTRRWLEDGLRRPPEAEMARDAYIASEDEFQVFIDEELILEAANAWTPSKEVFKRYRHWCESQGMKPMSMQAFSRKLVARGVPKYDKTSARGFKCFLQVPKTAAGWGQDILG